MDDREAMVSLRDNLSRATTKTAIIESFYAVTQTAAQNLAVSDAVAALETLAKIRKAYAVFQNASNVSVTQAHGGFAFNVGKLLEPKP